MGLYIEDIGTTIKEKIDWLDENGSLVAASSPQGKNELSVITGYTPKMNELLVCCVDNGAFCAVGVAYKFEERRAFNSASDGRHKLWYAINKDILKTKCPLWDMYVKE